MECSVAFFDTVDQQTELAIAEVVDAGRIHYADLSAYQTYTITALQLFEVYHMCCVETYGLLRVKLSRGVTNCSRLGLDRP